MVQILQGTVYTLCILTNKVSDVNTGHYFIQPTAYLVAVYCIPFRFNVIAINITLP